MKYCHCFDSHGILFSHGNTFCQATVSTLVPQAGGISLNLQAIDVVLDRRPRSFAGASTLSSFVFVGRSPGSAWKVHLSSALAPHFIGSAVVFSSAEFSSSLFLTSSSPSSKTPSLRPSLPPYTYGQLSNSLEVIH